MSTARSVVLVTGSYDQEIRFWEAWSGGVSRIITKTQNEVGVRPVAVAAQVLLV